MISDSYEGPDVVCLCTATRRAPLQKVKSLFEESSNNIAQQITKLEQAFAREWTGYEWSVPFSIASSSLNKAIEALLLSHPIYRRSSIQIISMDVLRQAKYTIIERPYIQ